MIQFLKMVVCGLISRYHLRSLGSHGTNVHIAEHFIVSGSENIFLGNSVHIGPNATIFAADAPLTIKGHFMSGPGLTIITGDHRIDLKDKFMDEVTVAEKLPENDLPVVIEEDVWCGANVTILKGVHIGRGSVVAAGAVVTKNIGEYEIWGGVPARKIRDRFSDQSI